LIDVHAHYFDRAYVDLLDSLGADRRIIADARRALSPAADDGIAERLDVMHASGVERQILSMSAVTPYVAAANDALRAARFLNDRHAELRRAHPGQFGFFATLPMPHIDAAHAELARAFDELHAEGVTFTTSVNGRSLADPEFATVFAELDRRAAVVFLHPPGFACESPPIEESGLGWAIGAPVEDAVCALQLVRADFPARYPRLKIIVPHLGGFLPFLRYRLDRGKSVDEKPSTQLRKFWYDTANGEPASLRHAVEVYGADRVLFGSDYPYWTGDAYAQAVLYLELAGLSEAQVDGIRSKNARALLRPS
jgi:6-methylsalicylate decarboxylase